MRKFTFIFLSLCVFGALGFTNQRSIDWQKVDFQGTLTKRIEKKVKTLVKDDTQYLIDVKVAVNQPDTPAFSQANDDSEEEEVKSDIKHKDALQYIIKDYSKEELPRDSIVFSKFGLMAPVMDELLEGPSNGMNNLDVKDDNAQQNQGVSFGDAWKFNRNFDLFENLESIEINVTMDKSINENLLGMIKQSIESMDLTYNDITAQVNVKTAELNFSQETLSGIILRMLKEFHQALIIFLSLLAVYFISMLANRKKSEADAKTGADAKGAKSESINQKLSVKEEPKKDRKQGGGNGQASPQKAQKKVFDGIERFKSVLTSNKDIAIKMVEGWIKSKDEDSQLKLNSIIQQLDTDALNIIVKSLDQKRREELKGLLGAELSASDASRANNLLLAEVLESLILPNRRLSTDFLENVMAMTSENTAVFMKENQHLASILFYEMKTDFITKALVHLDPDFREKVLASSVSFEPEDNADLYQEFMERIPKYFDERKIYPGLVRAKEIIYSADSSTEESLYKALLRSTDAVIIEKMLMTKFPSFLLTRMSDEFLKEVFSIFPMESKVPFFYGLEEGLKERFMKVYAPEGSVAHDLITLEFEKFNEDESAAMEAEEKLESYWEELLEIVNDQFEVDPRAKKAVKQVISEWVEANGKETKKAELSLAS